MARQVSFGGAQIDQAAAGNIVNKAPAFQIGGNVGAAVNVKEGTTVHIHVASALTGNPSSEQEVNRVVSILLRTCKDAGCQQTMERISLVLFGNSMFKSLRVEQVLKLQQIADEFAAQADATELRAEDITAKLEQAEQQNQELQQHSNTTIQTLQAKVTEQGLELANLRQAKPARPLCQTCSSATANLAKARRGLVTIGSLAILGLAATSFFSYSTYAANQALKAAEARLTVCEFEGRTYSQGSLLVRNGAADWRCTANNGVVAWEEIKNKRKR